MTAPSVPLADDRAVLLRLVKTAHQIKDRLRDSGFNPAQCHAASQSDMDSSPPLALPYPHDVETKIQKSITSISIQSRIISSVRQWYQNTQQLLKSQLLKTLDHLAGVPRLPGITVGKELCAVYEATFRQKMLPALRSQIDAALAKATAQERCTIGQKGKRRAPFNHECLPLLETYFEYNAYPSTQDRALLARKTMMCPRQIEVWFQNHRTRARKEGRQLRRPSEDPLPHQLSLEPLNKSMPGFLVPKEELKPTSVNVHSPAPTYNITAPPSVPAQATDAFCAPSPTYAFPIQYRSDPDQASCLLTVKAWSFPPPAWPRQASSKMVAFVHKATITPDELAVELQQKLSLTGAGGAKRPRSPRPSPPTCYPVIVIPMAAPLFALICQPPPHPSKPTSKEPDILLSVRRSCDSKPTPFSKYQRPTPYQKRRLPQNRSLRQRTPSDSSFSSISSFEESDLRTPSPSPPPKYMLLAKGTSTSPQYRDWGAWLLPT